MPKYHVMMPVAGFQVTEVEADSEQEAIDKAYENGCLDMDDPEVVDGELNAYTKVLNGNVLQIDCTEASAEEIDEEEKED